MSSKQYRVLLVEDEPISQVFTKKLFANKGFIVDVAAKAGEGFELLQSNYAEYNLIVTDLELPDFSGLELVKKIRAWESSKHKNKSAKKPIVALSSRVDSAMQAKCIMVGMQNAYMKPLNETAMNQIISIVLNNVVSFKEFTALVLYNKGYTRKDSAKIMHMSEHTYAWYLKQLRNRFKVKTRQEMQELEDKLEEGRVS
jgi:CheY-like chemotaxis protein